MSGHAYPAQVSGGSPSGEHPRIARQPSFTTSVQEVQGVHGHKAPTRASATDLLAQQSLIEAASARLENAASRNQALERELQNLKLGIVQRQVEESTTNLSKLLQGGTPALDAVSTDAAGVAAKDVLWELACGNKRFLKKSSTVDRSHLVDVLATDPLNPATIKAIVVAEARSLLPPLDDLFDMTPGSFQVVRVCGFTACGHRCGVVGSLEYAFSDALPNVLMVMGNADNEAVAGAVRVAMKAAGRSDAPEPPKELSALSPEEDLDLIKFLLPAASDALAQMPRASFSQLCLQAIKMNIWNTIESILTHSTYLSSLARKGKVELHGVFLHASGAAEFLGQHPSIEQLLQFEPTQDIIRTAADPPVPGEQALAELYAGNRRYTQGKGGKMMVRDERLLTQLTESGQNPIAIVLGCADSRAPVEILFDQRPGDLFVLRTAGNTVSSAQGTIIGSAEYAVGMLRTKLLVVCGHTKCGAVTATVDSVKTNKPQSGFPGSIGHVLADMTEVAAETVKQEPDSAMSRLVTLATQMNVFSTIEKFIRNSEMIKSGIQTGELHIHGAVYDILSGEVEWLGAHPQLEEIMEMPLPMHQWNVTPYMRHSARPARNAKTQAAINKLIEGNKRFCSSAPAPAAESGAATPYAIVVAGCTLRVPVEHIFSARPGELLVQRVAASLGGRQGGTIFASLEYAAARYAPAVLVFLGSYGSEPVKNALKHLQGDHEEPGGPKQYVLERLMVSAMRAYQQVSADKIQTAAGRDVKLQHLAEELNLLYSIEQMLRSPLIRSMVEAGTLEIHAAILNEATGEVVFVGEHPMAYEMIGFRRSLSNDSMA